MSRDLPSNSVAAATPDANSANNRAAVALQVVSGIEVALAKTLSAGPYYAGKPFSYTLRASNLGALDATSLTVDDVLPAALSFVSASGSGWNCVYQAADRRVTCFAATLAADACSRPHPAPRRSTKRACWLRPR